MRWERERSAIRGGRRACFRGCVETCVLNGLENLVTAIHGYLGSGMNVHRVPHETAVAREARVHGRAHQGSDGHCAW